MMKKMIAVVLVLSLMLTLAACGGSSAPASSAPASSMAASGAAPESSEPDPARD